MSARGKEDSVCLANIPNLEVSDYLDDNFPGVDQKFNIDQIGKFINWIKEYTKYKIEYIMYDDSYDRFKYGLPLSKSINKINCHSTISAIINKCLTGNYIFLLFLDHGIGILVKRCNIKHCAMIDNSSKIDSGFSKPPMIFMTPIVDLSFYTESLQSNKLLSIFDKLLTDKYYTYDKDDISIAFYKAIGFDVDKHICIDVEPYGSDDD